MQVLYVCDGFERITEEVCSQTARYVDVWLKYISFVCCAHTLVYICFISEISPQDAFQIESELFVKYYSERKKKEVSTDATYSTIPQFYFKVR
jgi:hypothetical protein